MDRMGKPVLFGLYPRAEMYLVERDPLVVPTLGVLWIIKDLPSPRPSAIVEIKGPLVQEIPASPLDWEASVSELAPDLGVIVMDIQVEREELQFHSSVRVCMSGARTFPRS